jgi:hypothetical protein
MAIPGLPSPVIVGEILPRTQEKPSFFMAVSLLGKMTHVQGFLARHARDEERANFFCRKKMTLVLSVRR